MSTDAAITAEYARIRSLHIRELRSIAQTMLQGAIALEGTNLVPQAHWQSSVPPLTKQVTELHTLARYVQAAA